MQWRRCVFALGCLVVGSCSGVIEEMPGAPAPADAGEHPPTSAGSGGAGVSGGAGRGGSTAAGSGGQQQPPGPYEGSVSAARRLSRAELDNTLRDLLGDTTAPASGALAEDLFAPYDNDYTTQLASSAYIETLEVFASDVANRALTTPAQRAKLVPCASSDEACFRSATERLLARAFRRPLASSEADAYLPLLALAQEPDAVLVNGSAFDTALALVVRAVVQDPEFLYRVEAGTALTDHEIAVRMSYLLWGTTPDDTLRAAAEAGGLGDASRRRAAAERMLSDARARDQLHRFHAMWLGYRAIPHSAELAAAFARETNALLDRVIFEEPQSYLNLFTFDETYLDATLAEHYGLPRPSSAAAWVSYGDSGRAGILSHGSVLSAFGKFTDTSPTQRGIFVRTRLMCQEIPPPPPNVVADQPPAGDANAVCKYDRYREHRTSSSCSGCHSLTDGIGFGLENYDLAGRFRTHDEGLTQCTIEGSGELTGIGSFSGPKELGAMLRDRGEIDACVVKQYLQFALGRAPASDEAALVEDFSRAFREGRHDLTALILRFVESDAFARRVEPEAP